MAARFPELSEDDQCLSAIFANKENQRRRCNQVIFYEMKFVCNPLFTDGTLKSQNQKIAGILFGRLKCL